MTVRELMDELSKLPADVPVFVAQSPAFDHFGLEIVVELESDENYVLLAGPFDDE